jgi:hypothetical protein
MFAERMRGRIGHRALIVVAGAAGFALGAAGFVAASHDSGELEHAASSSASSSSTSVSTTVEEAEDDTSTSVATTVEDDDDNTSTSVANTVDATSTSVDDDDDTSTSVATTIDDDGDDNTSTSVATTIDDDDDTSTSSSTTNAPAGPAPFTQSYSSTGGSITVTWNGASLSLDAINPAPGFAAEIEDAGGSRVRVDFESNGDSGGDDARIEVRVEDGRLEVRVD